MKKIYQNPESNAIPVFADSAQSQKIGKLYAGSSCVCIDEHDGLAIVLYKVGTVGAGVCKVGFADAKGIQG